MLAQEPELDDQQTQDTGQGNSAHDPPSESKSPSSAPCARPVPESDFDMIDFMHQSAAYDMQQVLQQAEDLPPIPPHVFSERSGGEARRVMLKSRTSTITRSVSEVFAYSTSRTISVYLDFLLRFFFLQLFELICGLEQRRDGFLHTGSALAY